MFLPVLEPSGSGCRWKNEESHEKYGNPDWDREAPTPGTKLVHRWSKEESVVSRILKFQGDVKERKIPSLATRINYIKNLKSARDGEEIEKEDLQNVARKSIERCKQQQWNGGFTSVVIVQYQKLEGTPGSTY